MIIRIAVCDDKVEYIDKVLACANNYFDRQECKAEFFTFTSSFEFLESLQHTSVYDIVLLDICMPIMLGTDVAKEIRQRKDKTEIIFITTSDQFAVDAFVLKAAHYLVKPFNQAEFDEAMDRATKKVLAEHNKNIVLKLSGGSVQVVCIDDILYIENFAHTQSVHLKGNACLEAKESITQLMSMLEEVAKDRFFSPYKGIIVNMNAIMTIEPCGIKLKDGTLLPIVKRSFRDLQKKYFDYMFGHGGTL